MSSARSPIAISLAIHSTLIVAAIWIGGREAMARYRLTVAIEPTPEAVPDMTPPPEKPVEEADPIEEPEPDTFVIAETFEDVEVRDDLPEQFIEPAKLKPEDWRRRVKPKPPQPAPVEPTETPEPEPVVTQEAKIATVNNAPVQEAVIELVPGTNEPPAYPAIARRRGWQGVVLVEFEVDADGNVLRCSVKRSSGYPQLDHAAVHAVKKWRFSGGPGVATQELEFRLR